MTQKVIKVLNLYAGIGGNRLLWPKNVKVTAVEQNASIAAIYSNLFPKDIVVVGDAHEYLIKHYKEFDFIWSSTPCPTHSVMGYLHERVYPDMNLYQEVIFLQHHFKGRFVVENVKPYYKPLIQGKEIGRHYIWSNFAVPNIEINNFPNFYNNEGDEVLTHQLRWLGMPLKPKDVKGTGLRANQVVRNCVHPKIGLHIFNHYLKHMTQKT